MATVTGLTAERMLEIEAASVVDGDVVGNDLILAKHDGSIINAGNVRGPAGPVGPMGSSLAVVSAQPVYDVGIANQLRAGRQLTPSDFTNLGLSVPIGLWNLSNFSDSSGNGRTLTNKGSVPIGVGINGLASTAAVFSGSTAQVAYIADTGVADPFRIKNGSWGCWMRTAKRGVQQYLLCKMTGVAGQYSWALQVDASNHPYSWVSNTGGNVLGPNTGLTDVCDDKWHFLVSVFDGHTLRLFVDGVCEITSLLGVMTIWPAVAPLNIGGAGGDASTATVSPTYGRVDEAFVTNDALTEEQVRNLYCASIPHALGSLPTKVHFSVRRKRRGAPHAAADFPSQPLRLYNFTGGVLTDQGSNNVPVTVGGGGTIADATGADGLVNGAKAFFGAHTGLAATDAGLPAALTSRSYGAWMKATQSAGSGCVLVSYGTLSTADVRVYLNSTGLLQSANAADTITGPYVIDGAWHHVVVVEDNAAADGIKRRLYVDGECVGGSTVMVSITLAGANRFRIGASPDGSSVFLGQLDGAFVFAGALTTEQVRALYNVVSQALAPSPKAPEDHIEALETARLLAVFDTIEACDSIDLAVMA